MNIEKVHFYLKKSRFYLLAIIGFLITTGGFFTAIGAIKDSDFRPIIKIELTEETKAISEKFQKELDILDLNLIASNLERWDSQLRGLDAEQYQLWKDEQTLGPKPKIKERQRQIQNEIDKLKTKIQEEEKRKKDINKRRGN